MRRQLNMRKILLSVVVITFFLLASVQSFALENVKEVTVHYHRFDEAYEGWNLWIWPEGKDGKGYEFTDQDDYGMYGTFQINSVSDVNRIGFLLRRSEDGNAWAEKELGDRYFKNHEEITDIYLVEGDETVYFTEDAVDLSPKLQAAFLDDLNKITLYSNFPMDISKDEVSIHRKNDTVAVQSIQREGAKATLVTEKNLQLSEKYTVSIEGYNDQSLELRRVFDTEAFNQLYYYEGNDLGATYTKKYTTFKVWAPTADQMDLILYNDQVYSMTKEEKGVWSVKVQGDLHNKLYNYQIVLDGKKDVVVDPYAKGVGINGKKGAIIDFDRLDPEGWNEFYKTNFSKDTDAIMYELHIRDLSIHEDSGIENKGKFLGVSEVGTKNSAGNFTGLSYIKDLGVTHIQLMPVYDFKTIDERNSEDQYNWGYDPQNYNALEGSYSTDPANPSVRIKEFKQMIHAIHNQGLRVTMDVVYNHVYDAHTMSFERLVPGYFFRKNKDNSFANGSGCGNETASDRPMMRKFMVDSIEFLTKEYNLDGFRFDLMGLHDVKTMNAIREKLDSIDPSITLIGEGWNMGNNLIPNQKANQLQAEKMADIAHFNDTIRDGLKGSVFEAEEKGFVNGNYPKGIEVKRGIVGGIKYNGLIYGWGDIEPNQSVTYVEAHDNNTLYDKLLLTNPEADVETIEKMHTLADSIILTSQGIPFIHAGQEFMRTKDGDENSYKSSDQINQLDWQRKDEYDHLVDYFRGMIILRKNHPAFRMPTKDLIKKHLAFIQSDSNVIAYHLKDHANNDEWSDIVVIHNAARENKNIPLPEKGLWNVVVDGSNAGVETLEQVTGESVEVEALTTKVLYFSKTETELKNDSKTPSENTESSNKTIYFMISIILLSGFSVYFWRRKK